MTEILRKVKCSERLPKFTTAYVTNKGKELFCTSLNSFVIPDIDDEIPISARHKVSRKYWYESIEIELKSEEILPKENRDRFGNNYGKTYVNRCLNALEAAELEIIELKSNKSAKEKYDKAYSHLLEYNLGDGFNFDLDTVKEALKIAAGINE